MNRTATKEEFEVISLIAKRAHKMAFDNGVDYSVIDACMDLENVHCNGTPLNLKKLLAFRDGDFGHDVFGIRRHLNHVSKELGGCFLPRCAKTNN